MTITSLTVFAGSDGPDAIMSGTDTNWMTGVKSRIASYVTLR